MGRVKKLKIAIFSDLHANGAALDAFLDDTKKIGVNQYWFLGDAVGYGPEPVKCLKWVLDNVPDKHRVWGNHDMMLHGLAAAQDEYFCQRNHLLPQDIVVKAKDENNELRKMELSIVENLMKVKDWQSTYLDAIEIIQKHLKDLATQDWFNHRILIKMYRDQRYKLLNYKGMEHWFVHGTLDTISDNYRYMFPWRKEYLELDLVFLKEKHKKKNQIRWGGHTHVPMIQVADRSDDVPRPIFYHYHKKYSIDYPYVFLNPGSLGFPRDLDQRGSYLLFYPEEREVEFRRFDYPVRDVYNQMKNENYPRGILNRLRDATFPGKENEFKAHFENLMKEEG